jgi:hypothetical protein
MFVGDWLIDCDTLEVNDGAHEIICHAVRVSAAAVRVSAVAGTMAFELDGAVCKPMCGGVFLTTLTRPCTGYRGFWKVSM